MENHSWGLASVTSISSVAYVCIGMVLRMVVYAVVYAAVYVVIFVYVLDDKAYQVLKRDHSWWHLMKGDRSWSSSEKHPVGDNGENITIRTYQVVPEKVNQ